MNYLLQPITNENKIGKYINGLPVLNALDERIPAMLEAWAQNDIQAASESANEIKEIATNILTQQSKHLHAYVAIGLTLTVYKGIEGFKEGLEIIQQALEIFPAMYPQSDEKREHEATVLLGKPKTSLIKILSSKTNDREYFSKILKEAYDISCQINNGFGTLLSSALEEARNELSPSALPNEAGEPETSMPDTTQINPNAMDESHFNFNHESAIHQLRQLKNFFERADPYNPVNIALDLALLWCKGKNINDLLEHREDLDKVAKFVKKLKSQSQGD